MTSNLACVGLGVTDSEGLSGLVSAISPALVEQSVDAGVTTLRWTDPSGSRLTCGVTASGELADLLPSYAGTPGVRLAGLRLADDQGTAVADVVDEHGELCTRLACDFEQWRALADGAEPETVLAAVTALGLDVTVHTDEAAYAESEASLLGDPDAPRPDDLAEGMVWPPRKAAESFFPYGLFGDQAHPHAGVSGTVLAAQTREVGQTGQVFHAVRLSVASLGMELDLCLSAQDHPLPPGPGNVVDGTVYLVGSADSLWSAPPAPARKRWFGRRA